MSEEVYVVPSSDYSNPTVEENYIQIETQSQVNTQVTPSGPEGSKGKGNRHSEGLITAKKWTPIATQRNRKPQNSASIQGKLTLTAFTGNITVINPVVNSKGKLPKAADNIFVQGTVKETLFSKGTSQRTKKACPEPEDLEEDTFDTVVDGKKLREILPTLPFTFQFNRNLKQDDWEDMDQVLQLHQLLKDLFQQEVQPGIPLGRNWRKFPEYLSQRDRIQRPYGNQQRRTTDPDIAYSDSSSLTRSRPNQLSSGFTPFRNQQISVQESPFFTIPGSFQEKTATQRKKQDHLQPKEERVRPNDPEAVGFGERSTQEPEVAVHNPRISSPINRNITFTQIEHNVVPPDSSLNSDHCGYKCPNMLRKLKSSFQSLKQAIRG
ncbi:hypothetical protein O181_042049 [Austropuccinia psidii MF-1]|uniref:Uncharacterized protein n=1 Tax=Austropuccinia psidii MF-1 TaxID=1389203 RepID=A0A9Q3DFM4_9BASI|nr:hypothetical protein [Austropuccinia psidii MF-1]